MIKYIRANYIFNIIALMILISSFTIFLQFKKTQKNIVELNYNKQIEQVEQISNNIKNMINSLVLEKNIYETLKNSRKIRQTLEKSLQLFITDNYRYVYVVDKYKNSFRFLLDGSKNSEEKSEFGELFNPIKYNKWNQVYKEKKVVFFKNKEAKNIWVTFLKPIIINNKVQAIIAIDFSLKEHNKIVSILDQLNKSFIFMMIFVVFIFVVIVVFSYLDKKREHEKDILYQKLKNLNATLEKKIKIAVEENLKKEKLLHEQTRLAQMGEMISMIAHQWRQPLNAISSSIIAIESKLAIGRFDLNNEEDKEKFLQFLQKKHNSVNEYIQTMSETIDDFRNFFKPDKQKEEVEICTPILKALKIVKTPMNNKGIEINFDCNIKEKIFIYQNEIMQVILNILKNAEDHFKEKNIANGKIDIEVLKENNQIIIQICDNGGGIPQEILPKIFDPYFSTKDEKNGTGLGLYMSKTIIEKHHKGKLIANNSGSGACFKIILFI